MPLFNHEMFVVTSCYNTGPLRNMDTGSSVSGHRKCSEYLSNIYDVHIPTLNLKPAICHQNVLSNIKAVFSEWQNEYLK